MKRVKLCSVILVVLITITIGTLFMIQKKCTELKDLAGQTLILYENKSTEEALKKAEELNQTWDKHYKFFHCSVKNDKLYNINSEIAKIKPLIENNDDQVISELNSLIYELDFLSNNETPHIYNII